MRYNTSISTLGCNIHLSVFKDILSDWEITLEWLKQKEELIYRYERIGGIKVNSTISPFFKDVQINLQISGGYLGYLANGEMQEENFGWSCDLIPFYFDYYRFDKDKNFFIFIGSIQAPMNDSTLPFISLVSEKDDKILDYTLHMLQQSCSRERWNSTLGDLNRALSFFGKDIKDVPND